MSSHYCRPNIRDKTRDDVTELIQLRHVQESFGSSLIRIRGRNVVESPAVRVSLTTPSKLKRPISNALLQLFSAGYRTLDQRVRRKY